MVELSVVPEEMRAKMSRLQAEVRKLQEFFDDFSLTKDDLDAIGEGQRDFKLGRTRRL